MSKVFLIAETPRAGKWNHRYLVAEGNTLSERTIANFVSSARHEPIGKNYIAVKRDVSQEQSGRTGQEILVLVGINTECLSDNEKQKITTSLESCLTNGLDRLVTNTIEWNSIGTSMLVERSELNEWGKQFSRLPHIEIIETNSFEFTHQKISRVELTKMGKFNQLTHWFLEFSWGVKLMLLSVVTIGVASLLTPDRSWCLFPFCSDIKTEATDDKHTTDDKQAIDALHAWIKDAGLTVNVIQTTKPLNNLNEKSTQQQLDVNSKNVTIDKVLQDLNNIQKNPMPLQSSDVLSWYDNWEQQKFTLTMKLVSKETATEIQRYLPVFTKQSSLADIVKERNLTRDFYKKLKDVTPKQCDNFKPAPDQPYLKFVCTCSLENKCNISDDDNDSLIFFSQYDSKRVKALISFYKNGMGSAQSDPTPEELSHKLFIKLCELADKEKNPKTSLRQKSRKDKTKDENTITDEDAPWKESLENFAKVFEFEQCSVKPAAPTQKNTDTGKK